MKIPQTRKSIHINLTRNTHAELRILAFKNELSMQEIFEELAIQLIENETRISALLLEIKERKKNREISRISSTDAETIYGAINDSDPFERKG